MKALRLLGPNDLQLQDIERPELEDGWCRIKVLRVGVCGSDISSIAGKLIFTHFPITPGHEFSGIITETRNCQKFHTGMYVTANPIFSCGECEACQKGELNHCTQTEVLGVVSHDGCYAEEVVVPEKMLFEIPENVPAERGAMIEPVTVALTALKKACVKEGSKVAVFGAGNIGLVVIGLAKSLGAQEVLAVDMVEDRLKVAVQMGADRTVTVTDLENHIDDYSSHYDCLIDGVGIESVMALMVKMVKPGGHIDVYGVPKGTYLVPVQAAFVKDVTISTSRLYGYDMSEAIRIVADENSIDFDPMITHRVSLQEFSELSKKIVNREVDSIKVILEVNEK